MFVLLRIGSGTRRFSDADSLYIDTLLFPMASNGPIAASEKKEPSWHRRAKKERRQARAILAVNNSTKVLAEHHGGGVSAPGAGKQKWQCWGCGWIHPYSHDHCSKCRRVDAGASGNASAGVVDSTVDMVVGGAKDVVAAVSVPASRFTLEEAKSMVSSLAVDGPPHLVALRDEALAIVQEAEKPPEPKLPAIATSSELTSAEQKVTNLKTKSSGLATQVQEAEEALTLAQEAQKEHLDSLAVAEAKVLEIRARMPLSSVAGSPNGAVHVEQLAHLFLGFTEGKISKEAMGVAFAEARSSLCPPPPPPLSAEATVFVPAVIPAAPVVVSDASAVDPAMQVDMGPFASRARSFSDCAANVGGYERSVKAKSSATSVPYHGRPSLAKLDLGAYADVARRALEGKSSTAGSTAVSGGQCS